MFNTQQELLKIWLSIDLICNPVSYSSENVISFLQLFFIPSKSTTPKSVFDDFLTFPLRFIQLYVESLEQI